MSRRIGYRLLNAGLMFGLGLSMVAGVAIAQQAPKTPLGSDVYCSGVATDEAVPRDTYLISGEDSDYKISFLTHDLVYINRGADQGVKVGDQFEVSRPVHDRVDYGWFNWQPQLTRAMGKMYMDLGRLRVVNVQAKTSIAEVVMSCEEMERGDIVRPFTARVAPTYHETQFDPFAPPSGKKTAMIVNTKRFGQAAGPGTTVYVNLGSSQGVQVGDYFRVFRYQGTNHESSYQNPGTAYKMYGFGSTPVAYQWNDVPRQVLGEGIVLRTGPNSATVLITIVRQEIYVGDYVEIE